MVSILKLEVLFLDVQIICVGFSCWQFFTGGQKHNDKVTKVSSMTYYDHFQNKGDSSSSLGLSSKFFQAIMMASRSYTYVMQFHWFFNGGLQWKFIQSSDFFLGFAHQLWLFQLFEVPSITIFIGIIYYSLFYLLIS